jgi:hypothetical protein
MLLKTPWSLTMFALATVDTMFSVSVKVLVASDVETHGGAGDRHAARP